MIATIAITVKLRETRKRRKALKKSFGDDDDQTGNALLAILILFLICEMPIGIILLLNIIDKRFYSVFLSFLNFTSMMRLLNASLNFILYCTMSSLFRTKFKEIVNSFFRNKKHHIDSSTDDAICSCRKCPSTGYELQVI